MTSYATSLPLYVTLVPFFRAAMSGPIAAVPLWNETKQRRAESHHSKWNISILYFETTACVNAKIRDVGELSMHLILIKR